MQTLRTPSICLPPVHPGRTLTSEMAARLISIPDLAYKTGLPADYLAAVCSQQVGITERAAQCLGTYFGTGDEIWKNLQADYEKALADAGE